MQGLISHTLNRNSDYALLILLAILVLLITLAITSHSGDKYSGKTKGVVTDIFFVMPKGLTMHLSNGIDFRKNLKIGLSCPVHKKGPFYGQQVHFSVPVHGNARFYGQEITIQSGLIREEGAKLR